jgi:dipeptidyl-peptidase-4
MNPAPATLLALVLFVLPYESLLAQGSRADYERAASLSRVTANKMFRDRIQAQWLPGNTQLWYEVRLPGDKRNYIFVDAVKGERRTAFDTAKLADALRKSGVTKASAENLSLQNVSFKSATDLRFRANDKHWSADLATYALTEQQAEPAAGVTALSPQDAPQRSRRTGDETSLTFVNGTQDEVELFWLSTEGERRSYGRLRPSESRDQHTFAGHVWLAAARDGKPIAVFEATERGGEAMISSGPVTRRDSEPRRRAERPRARETSPDGQWRAVIKDHNVTLRDEKSGEEFRITTDGTTNDPYRERFYWAPDSKKLVVIRVKKGDERKVHIVESSPKDQLQPKLHSFDYLKPGDKLPNPRPVLIDVAGRTAKVINNDLFSNPFTESGDMDIRWHNSSRFTFRYNQRGHQILRIISVDATTGEPTAIVDEQSKTFIDYSGKYFAEFLNETDELIWMSERDGWNHLYLYDTKTGHVKNQITRGEWVVRGVDRVDPQSRQIWFRAGGIRPGQDPYHVHHCRVNFDGSSLTVLTEGDGTHTVEFSPDRRFAIDTYSRVDAPPVIELRKTDDGSLVCELERSDISELRKTGWQLPERFVSKARDGKTEIYGVIIRPTNFQPGRKYPVIENIYAGPQSAFVPKNFRAMQSMLEMAELGFILVQIDGMGTSHRSKAFHDVAFKNLADAGLPDRVLWIKAAAAKYPEMDIARVGIYGGSAGGQNSTRAMLDHGDFYKVGVSDCGCHDNRMDKIWWNEQWLGWPVDESYERSSNVTDAHKLQGKLLLIVGELDRNVDPASTMQVVNALIKANKDFDLLILPGVGHGSAESSYGKRRRADYFVRHLLNKEPRWEAEQ